LVVTTQLVAGRISAWEVAVNEEAQPIVGTLVARAWIDPVVEAVGYGPTSSYVEHCWLPVLGPTATWLYRRLGRIVQETSDPVRIDLADLALGLGLGRGLGRQSPLCRSLGRLGRFSIVRPAGPALEVRRALAPLTELQLVRLGPGVRRWHDQLATG